MLLFWNINKICFETAKKRPLVSWSIHSFATFEVQIWELCWFTFSDVWKTVTLWMQFCSSNNCLLPVTHTLALWNCISIVFHLEWYIALTGAFKFWYAVPCKMHHTWLDLKNDKSKHACNCCSFLDQVLSGCTVWTCLTSQWTWSWWSELIRSQNTWCFLLNRVP
jgi:hypothetical protein